MVLYALKVKTALGNTGYVVLCTFHIALIYPCYSVAYFMLTLFAEGTDTNTRTATVCATLELVLMQMDIYFYLSFGHVCLR